MYVYLYPLVRETKTKCLPVLCCLLLYFASHKFSLPRDITTKSSKFFLNKIYFNKTREINSRFKEIFTVALAVYAVPGAIAGGIVGIKVACTSKHPILYFVPVVAGLSFFGALYGWMPVDDAIDVLKGKTSQQQEDTADCTNVAARQDTLVCDLAA